MSSKTVGTILSNAVALTAIAYIVLQILFSSLNLSSVQQYSIPSKSAVYKTYGATQIAATGNTAGNALFTVTYEGGQADAGGDCGKTTTPMALNNKENLFVEVTPEVMWLYDCTHSEDDSSKKDDDEDDDSDFSHCPRFEIDTDELHKGRFKNDRVQRLIPCPPLADDGRDCPADSNNFQAALSAAGKEFDFEDCELARTDKDCEGKLKFTLRQYEIGAMIVAVIYLLMALVYAIAETKSDGTETSGPGRIALFVIVFAHIAALVLSLVFLMQSRSVVDADGGCLGEYLETTLGMEVEDSTYGGHEGIVIAQLAFTVLGIFGATYLLLKTQGFKEKVEEVDSNS